MKFLVFFFCSTTCDSCDNAHFLLASTNKVLAVELHAIDTRFFSGKYTVKKNTVVFGNDCKF